MLFGFMFDVLPNVLFMCKCGSFWTKWQWTLFTIGSDMPTLNIASDELRMIWNVLLLHSLKLICSMKDIKWWKGACLLLQVTYHFFHWKKGTPFAEDQGSTTGWRGGSRLIMESSLPATENSWPLFPWCCKLFIIQANLCTII